MLPKTFDAEILLKLMPLASAILLGAGVISQILFYDRFGINILEFLELSEVVTLFFRNILYFLGMAIGVVAGISLLPGGNAHAAGESKTVHESNRTNPEISVPREAGVVEEPPLKASAHEAAGGKQKNRKIPTKGILIACSPLFILFVCDIVAYFLPGSRTPVEHLIGRGILSIGTWFVILAPFLVSTQSSAVKKDATNGTALILILIAAWFLCIVAYRSFEKAGDVKKDYLHIGSTITLGDSTIRTDSTIQYLGKTQQFLFLYNRKKVAAIVVPTSEVKQLEFVNIQ